ncbi:MAG TPA: SDR family NAD(P)-dependent oxidoreductase [Isosphaeraceae bacterium]|jgi:acyl transferase domain-containing protein/NAD(P)H-dependent flavin oxidoreductase YrpB (nitropropane dioxygenase family)/acyl carrier protein|nr:SDR family NAD(P)-dependent oxidoreductase [Isosphaeraceae bacterium]
MSRQLPRVLALSPSVPGDPRFLVAACRAGALGLADAGEEADFEAVRTVLDRAGRFSAGPFGLRASSAALTPGRLGRLPASVRFIVGLEPEDGDWSGVLARIEASGRRFVAEVGSLRSARAAARAGGSALILAGHEAGGYGGEESSFILTQRILAEVSKSVWVRGGVGPRVASACAAAGAAGVVLDGALLLARESPLPDPIRSRLERWDGGETTALRLGDGRSFRVHAPPGSPLLSRLRVAAAEGRAAWDVVAVSDVGWSAERAWPAGQDAALAAPLAARFVTVGGIVQAVERAMDEGPRLASSCRPFVEGSPLARSHRTRYPIVQGPMTRVSDTVPFAMAVADGGALPFLALALLRGADLQALLADAAARLGDRPWGVGILGFVPPELRREQIAAIRAARPRFALIAGGRPDQATELEREEIATYLHIPSPGLLRRALDDGARRFVLEGRECGGHVGPRSSFVLWEQAVATVLESLDRGLPAEEVHVLFAGGIHDARSSAMVAALASPLAARGVRLGVLLGTAYVFTEEAVATGAIVPGFQEEALRCGRTVLLETGPGHEIRVSPSPFVADFDRERVRLQAEGRPAEEVRAELEALNAGRLRVAAKGVDRAEGAGSPLVAVAPEDQKARGIYMLGQLAALRDRVTTIAGLHAEVADGGAAWLDRLAIVEDPKAMESRPADVAIVGMAAILPGAADVRTFWANTLRGFDAITEVPAGRWDWRLYYDPDPKAPDKITSKWGGFLPEVPFDPLRYGMPPTSLPSIEPMQLLTLEVARAAIEDAGYRDRPFPRDRTAVVLGAGGGAAQLAMGYAFRSYLPLLDTAIPGGGRAALERCGATLPEWTEDSFPGILLNVAAGRVANRLDLGGANYTVDAACGSSLAAASLAVRELESGAADMVVLGGADTVQNPFTYLAFSKTHAFSPRGRCRPFDASADGIVISEGIAAVVLKRLADAERDGDRIYAVIKGLGASSDGRAKGLTAPRPEGQVRALERAYARSGIDPSTVGYVEAHGTGTAAGDLAEVEALAAVFGAAGAAGGACAIGSVKSSIGHTKCAAGLAGLINAALALYHEVLPPTIGVNTLNPRARIDSFPFFVNTTSRPWLHAHTDRPRRAGVSAFGFGGTNFHAVLEAYDRDPSPRAPAVRDLPAELFAWRAADRARLLRDLDRLAAAHDAGARPALPDLAHAINEAALALDPERHPATLAIVATSLPDLIEKVARARAAIARGVVSWGDPSGNDFAEGSELAGARVAFLFPGQGAQYVEMLADLAMIFPEVRRGFEAIDAALIALGRRPVGSIVFPPPAFDEEGRRRRRTALVATEVAQPAMAGASLGMLHLLDSLGLKPDLAAGHSFGELVALRAAGVFSDRALAELAEARGRFLLDAVGEEPGTMAAVAAGIDRVRDVLDGEPDVAAVNFNGPNQTVISGPRAAVVRAISRAEALGLRAQALPVACAFHSPLVAGAREPLAHLAARLGPKAPRLPVYSNVTAAPYPADPDAIAANLGEHVVRPVRFAEMIEALHADGARVFLEVGPGSTLTPLVAAILGGRPHLALATDRVGGPSWPAMLRSLGRLFVAGIPTRLDRLTEGRAARRLDLDQLVRGDDPLPASAWLVDGARARPAFGAEPPVFGCGPALPIPAATAEPLASPSRNGHAEPDAIASRRPIDPAATRIVESFQDTMREFLDVQRATMLEYLGARKAEAPGPDLDRRNGAPHVPRPSTNGHRPPAAEPVAVAKPTSAPKAPATDRASVAERLLRIVQERTGYPAETLRLDLDLEADLGIDSIKRVEILGSLRDALPALGLAADSEAMDALNRARTLAAIVDRVGTIARNGHPSGELPDVPPAVGPQGPSATAVASEPAAEVRRLVIEAVDAPRPATKARLAAGGIVLVTDDGRGIARAVAADLKALGQSVIRVRHGVSSGDVEGVNLTSEAAVSALLERLRGRGPIAGIVHALPLRDAGPVGLDPSAWSARLGPELRGLFLLARGAADDLERSAKAGGAALIAATALGGTFASVEPPAEFFPGHGGIAGLAKTISREWPEVRTRVVDFDPTADVEVLAAALVQEIFADDDRAEVGYHRGRRVALEAVAAPLPESGAAGIVLEPGEPVLVTGGARGITAAVALDLARRWRPTLLLVGTSPPPAEAEDPATAGLDSAADLKAAIHDRLRRDGRDGGPAEVELAYQALRREREIRANLRALREAGAVVEYARADVRDADAIGRILADWHDRFGPPVGLIHGAGMIQDKLLRDKTPESFDRVLGTKVEGALTLARLLRPEALRFTAFFSSVAGRFGNRGQGDYAAANEALNKLALWLDRRRPGRVVSMLWGPWSGVGMVSELEGHLGRRGLGMIPPRLGAPRFADELARGPKGAVEVLVAGELGPLERPEQRQY